MDKVTLVLILFILGIILVTVLPHIARMNPSGTSNSNRDPEFQAEKKPPKVIPVIVPVYPKEQPYTNEPRIIRVTPTSYPQSIETMYRIQTATPNIATMYRIQTAVPTPVNVPNSADVGLSQKNV